jgi:hypothetical protein
MNAPDPDTHDQASDQALYGLIAPGGGAVRMRGEKLILELPDFVRN